MSLEKLQIYGCLWPGWHTTYTLQLAQNDMPSSGQSVKTNSSQKLYSGCWSRYISISTSSLTRCTPVLIIKVLLESYSRHFRYLSFS